MYDQVDWAVIIPVANESDTFVFFAKQLAKALDDLQSGTIYFIVDTVSQDNTLELCQDLSRADSRFKTVWAPENKNVVDAYLRGYGEAVKNNHELILEMDAGLSHDPNGLEMFLRELLAGHECVFGSRFVSGGSMVDSNRYRFFLSKAGTVLSNSLLGTKMLDMTSGYQGFHKHIVEKFLKHNFLSTGHFYQTELRFLLRKTKYIEVPISYKAPSPTVSIRSVSNSFYCLFYYFFNRYQYYE